MKVGVTLALALACWASSTGLADPVRPAAPFWSQPCQAEAASLCKDVPSSQVPECLAAHEHDLSSGCAEQFLWRYRLTQDCHLEIAACQARMAAHGIPVSQCLKDSEKDLGARCRAALMRGSKRDVPSAKVARTARKKPPRKP